MGIFSSYAEMTGLSEGSTFVNEADLAEEMERLEEMESAQNLSDDPEEACIEAMMIGQENFHNLVMNITNEEVQYMLENGGEEVVYEGARLDALIDKIKSLIDRAWQKIKAIFEKALAAINSWVSTDKRFVEKYSAKIKGSSDEARKLVDTYDVDASKLNGSLKNSYSSIAAGVDKVVKDYGKGSSKAADGIDKSIVFGTVMKNAGISATTIEEVRTWAEKEIGLDKKLETKKTLTPDQIITELKDGKDNKKSIKTAYDNAKKAVATMKKTVDQAKRDAMDSDRKNNTSKASKDNSSYSLLISVINMALSAMSAVQRVHIRACNVYHSNCRKAAARAVRGVKDVKESYEFDGDTEYAFLQ